MKFFSNQRGVSMIEASVTLPIILSILMAIMESCWVMFLQTGIELNLQSTSREVITGNLTDRDLLTHKIRAALARVGLKPDDVQLCVDSRAKLSEFSAKCIEGGLGGADAYVRYEVSYVYKLLTPIFKPFMPEIKFQVVRVVKNEPFTS